MMTGHLNFCWSNPSYRLPSLCCLTIPEVRRYIYLTMISRGVNLRNIYQNHATMKRYVWVLMATLIVAGSSCRQAIDLQKEEEAIRTVLKEEANAVIAMDKERLFAVHLQDQMETRLEMGVYGSNRYQGWGQIETLLGDFMDGSGMGVNPVNRKDNMIIKVTGKTAWLTCDNIWEWSVDGHLEGYNNIQISVLEKVKGEWKISFEAYYSKPQP
jgi:hypothetical protein